MKSTKPQTKSNHKLTRNERCTRLMARHPMLIDRTLKQMLPRLNAFFIRLK